MSGEGRTDPLREGSSPSAAAILERAVVEGTGVVQMMPQIRPLRFSEEWVEEEETNLSPVQEQPWSLAVQWTFIFPSSFLKGAGDFRSPETSKGV